MSWKNREGRRAVDGRRTLGYTSAVVGGPDDGEESGKSS